MFEHVQDTLGASQMALVVKKKKKKKTACHCRRHKKTWVQSLDQEDPLEKEMATHSSILA